MFHQQKFPEENLEKKDINYVRQSMYRERRNLHPAQPKNKAEFHSILDDIGIVYSCLKYLGQHLYVPSAKISSETVHRNIKVTSHPPLQIYSQMLLLNLMLLYSK
jgi:hypothetical protein